MTTSVHTNGNGVADAMFDETVAGKPTTQRTLRLYLEEAKEK